jgi:hypothetical protein
VCGVSCYTRLFVKMLTCLAWASCDLESALTLYMRMPFTVLRFLCPCLYELFDFSSKAELRRGRVEGVERHGAMTSSAGWTLQTKRKRQGVRAPCKSNCCQASCSVRGKGCGQGSAKVKTARVLLDAEAGASDELPPLVKQSFKEGRYSSSTGMEVVEWQIMLEQFIAMRVVVKDKVINIDSD